MNDNQTCGDLREKWNEHTARWLSRMLRRPLDVREIYLAEIRQHWKHVELGTATAHRALSTQPAAA